MVHRMSSSKFMLHKSNSLNSMPPPRQQHSFTEEKSNGSAKWGAGNEHSRHAVSRRSQCIELPFQHALEMSGTDRGHVSQ
eukprot:3931705-Rhodomonas_salina.2